MFFSVLSEGNILIIVPTLSNVGCSIIGIHTATVLKEKGYEVTILSATGESSIIDEICEKDITTLLYGNFAYAKLSEIEWIKNFDYIYSKYI